MAFLLDTNHCIYLLNGLEKTSAKQMQPERLVVEKVEETQEPLFMCEVTLGELFYGAACSQRKEHNHARISRLSLGIIPLPVTQEIWELFGNAKAELRQKGRAMGDLDLLIACCASSHDLTLVTNDSDFEQLPFELSQQNWAIA